MATEKYQSLLNYNPMTFEPGHNLSSGRPAGIPNRRSRELEQRLKDRGDVDPADFCSSIVSNPNEPTELKLAAANYLLPYLYSKRGAMPPPRYIELEVDVNEFQHVSDAENFLAKIALLVARGHLDIQSGQELSALVKAWIDTQYQKDELAYKISPPETRDQTIHIEGGLPALPGTSITMPVLNGHAVQEQLLSAPKDVVPPNDGTNQVPSSSASDFIPKQNELSQGQLKAQGPHPLQKHHFAASPEETAPRKNSSNGGETQDGDPV
jgi:hypothetical protein